MLALLSLVSSWLSVPEAQAGVRVCKFNYTDGDDHTRLRTAMQSVFPPGVQMDGLPTVCRNPRGASASLDTWARLRSDGVTEWWTVRCTRDPREWECQTPEHHQLIWVYADIDGVQRRIEVSFSDATSVAQAKRAAVLAIRMLQDSSSAPLPACVPHSNTDWTPEWEKARKTYGLAPTQTAVEVFVAAVEPGVVHVTLGRGRGSGLGITITDGSGGLPIAAPACWAEWVVIG